jgi:ParB family transcriptional regulator, chromosome partitioning protein
MPLQLDDLAALDAPTPGSNGQPLMLPVDSIDEDPDQPRQDFDPVALRELADSIEQRGVLQAISVRPHPQQPQRWMVNMGARRLRASRMVGKPVVPAFVDAAVDSYDQIIENEQREGLKPLDLALFVQKRLALGDNKAEIARRLGKSRQWVTLATASIDAPSWLLQAYREGRCKGMAELYDLRRLHGDHAQRVQAWVAGSETITRERVAALKAELAPTNKSTASGSSAASTIAPLQSATNRVPGTEHPRTQTRTSSPVEKRIHVEFEGADVQLVLTAVPAEPGHMYVRPFVGGLSRLSAVAELKLRGFVGT